MKDDERQEMEEFERYFKAMLTKIKNKAIASPSLLQILFLKLQQDNLAGVRVVQRKLPSLSESVKQQPASALLANDAEDATREILNLASNHMVVKVTSLQASRKSRIVIAR